MRSVGRVARQGRPGAAFSFVAPKEVPYMIDCCLFIARKIENTHLSYVAKGLGTTAPEAGASCTYPCVALGQG